MRQKPPRTKSVGAEILKIIIVVSGAEKHHARYSISVTYTVGYGKKVQRNDETSRAGTAGSAMLK